MLALLGFRTPLSNDLLQRDGVEELDGVSLYLDQAFVLEARKTAGSPSRA